MRITALLIAITGAVVTAAGIALLALFGFDGVLSTDRHAVASTTPALVSSSADISGVAEAADTIGAPGVRIDLDEDRFVGVAKAADVERYLAGTPYDEVTDFGTGPFRLERHRVAGERAAAPPASQSFWVAQDASALRWKLRDGDYRIVVMSADGTTPLQATARFGVRVPFVPYVAVGLGIVGLALIAGAGLIAQGGTGRRAPSPAPLPHAT